jgi:hypothetical protein
MSCRASAPSQLIPGSNHGQANEVRMLGGPWFPILFW